ncbi:MAG: hypothetical protein NTY04_01680 [Candidatus Staskawiczbacteria bacterium]|nr:hypothetical protein [Candidatus Staskawiczbacteria bacterium]
MDFSIIYQLRTKQYWWMDVILYFVISLLVSTLLCYFIFSAKNNQQRKEIQNVIASIAMQGTAKQKQQEQDVINYRNKINDFSNLLKNHEFASNAFAFIEKQTMPNVWFKQINLDEGNATIQLSGEANSMDTFSRQVAIFESNKYIKNLGTLNSSLGGSAKVDFNIYIGLDRSVFGYLSSNTASSKTVTQPTNQTTQQPKTPAQQTQVIQQNNTITNIPVNSK